MALPKKGYKPGIYRFVSGTVDGNGDFSITNIPKDGYVSGIYQLTQVTIDDDGNTSVEEDDIGITAAIEVTVDGSGDLSVTEVPEEGYVSGVYKVTTSTNIPKEGFSQADFSAVIGSIVGGKWEGDSWLYRKKLTLTGSIDGALTNYQVRIVVDSGAGSDSGNTVYLNSKGKSSFGDVRFTDTSGAEIDYYLETPFNYHGATSATFWVNVPSIGASPATTDIYIYYGNGVALTTSSGANTFPSHFDDLDNTIDIVMPVDTDSGFSGGFDPVSRRLYTFGAEDGSGIAYRVGQWVNIDTGQTGIFTAPALVVTAVVYHPGEKKFFIYGGLTSYGATPYSTAVFVFDPIDDTWVQSGTAVIPEALAGISGCYDPVSGDIFLFGGSSDISFPFVMTDSIFRHDVSAGTIADTTANLNSGSWGMSPVYVDGLIYLLGGMADGGSNTSLDTIYTYDPSTPTVDPVVLSDTLSETRDTAVTWAVGTDIYIAGGFRYQATSGYFSSIDKLDTLTGIVSTITETLYTADDDGAAIYDSVTGMAYLWPIRHSSAPLDDNFKRVILKFNPITETFDAEPAIGAVPSGWTSIGTNTTHAPAQSNSSYMTIEDWTSSSYTAAAANFTSLSGKQVVDVEVQPFIMETNGVPNSQFRFKQQGAVFNSDQVAIIRFNSATNPNKWLFDAGGAAVDMGTRSNGSNVISAFVDTIAGQVKGSYNYGTPTALQPYTVPGKLCNQLWINTSTAQKEGVVVDWLRVRSWTTNEPAYTSWGTEESNPIQPT